MAELMVLNTCNVFVRRTSMEPVYISFSAGPNFFYFLNGSFDLVYEIRVKDVKFVPLKDIWRQDRRSVFGYT